MRKGVADILTILYVLITTVIAPIIGAMVETQNNQVITKSIGIDTNVTKVYPPIYVGE